VLHAYAKSAVKKMSYYCKLCKICVTHCMCIYIWLYVCVCIYVYLPLKVNSFLANLCSIPPRKCNMSLQQIPSMMQWCLRRWSYYFIKVCYQSMQHVFKKYSIKLSLLSRTLPKISKLEHTVLILRPSMFIAAVVKRLVPASLNTWRHRTASVQKGANGWKWPKPKKNLENKKNIKNKS